MNKHYLMSKFKSTGTAYLLWFFFGCHYAYLGMWGIQILYWIAILAGFVTLGITWIWVFVDLFLIPGKVANYNRNISLQIERLEKKEKEEDFMRNLILNQQQNNKSKTD